MSTILVGLQSFMNEETPTAGKTPLTQAVPASEPAASEDVAVS